MSSAIVPAQDLPLHPVRVPVILTYTDYHQFTHQKVISKDFPSTVLVRFSAAARKQLLEDGFKAFTVTSKDRGLHPAMKENFGVLLAFLEEMYHWHSTPKPVQLARAKPPFLFVHFAEGLTQALLCLELLKQFELDEHYRQDEWVRRWIARWIVDYDVLPPELVVAWRLFAGDPKDQQIAVLCVQKAVATWDARSMYFTEGQEQWAKFAIHLERQLFSTINHNIDAQRGKKAFYTLWTQASLPQNIRDKHWYRTAVAHPQKMGYSATQLESGLAREMLGKSRELHANILHKAIQHTPPQLSMEQFKKAHLRDGRWGHEVQIGRDGKEIKIWEYLGDDETEDDDFWPDDDDVDTESSISDIQIS